MKKLIILVVAIALLAGLTWIAIDLNSKAGQSDPDRVNFNFALDKVDEVDKIIITDKWNQTFELHKKGDNWRDKDGGCITEANVEYILEAIKNIEFKGYLPDNSIERYRTMLTAQHTKVQIFQNGEWRKTWYIGPASQDHYGQVMLLEDSENGKSDIPVMMKIKGFNGIIEPRFFADARQWACTNIFSLSAQQIDEVSVKYYDEPSRSFKVKRRGEQYDIYQQNTKLSGVDTSNIFKYLANYRKVHYNEANFTLNQKEIDSLKKSTPFATLEVKQIIGLTQKLKCYRIIETNLAEDAPKDTIVFNRDKFWCVLSDGSVVKCQYFVFNPLLMGHLYFPMDKSAFKTDDGITPKSE